MKPILFALLSLAATLHSQSCFGQNRALPFLTLCPDARSVALGNTVQGEAQGMWLYTNPSGSLHSQTRSSIDFSSRFLASEEGARGRQMLHTVSAAHRFAPRQALMLGWRYAGGLRFMGYDLTGQATKEYAPFDWAADVGYVHQLSAHWSSSARASFVYSHLSHNAHTAAFGLGLHYHNAHLHWGKQAATFQASLQVNDWGPQADYGNRYRAALPTHISGGSSLGVQVAPEHTASFSVSARHYWAQTQAPGLTTWGVGGEYRYRHSLSLQAGFAYQGEEHTHATLGLGLYHAGWRVQASYIFATSTAGHNALLLGLGYDF